MTRLLTNHFATLTEMRAPLELQNRSGGRPIAVLEGGEIKAFFIPQTFVDDVDAQNMDDVIIALKKTGRRVERHRLSAREIRPALRSVGVTDKRPARLDRVRIAYEFLASQTKVRQVHKGGLPLKPMIQNWAGRHVSKIDVEVAARLSPDIHGKYPNFNLSRDMVDPSLGRLSNIEGAMKHLHLRARHSPSDYARAEGEPTK